MLKNKSYRRLYPVWADPRAYRGMEPVRVEYHPGEPAAAAELRIPEVRIAHPFRKGESIVVNDISRDVPAERMVAWSESARYGLAWE